MKLLIVENDLPLQESMALMFASEGHQPFCASGVAEAETLAQQSGYGLIVLALGLPDKGAITLLSQWRRSGVACPVLILTEPGALAERVHGLDAGADDYLTKPFGQDELWIKAKALMRRYQLHGETSEQKETLVHSGDLTLNLQTQQVTLQAMPVEVTPREFALLAQLVALPGETVSRETLLERISWQDDAAPNTLEVHIHNLRRKLGKARIKTVRGVGYRLETQA